MEKESNFMLGTVHVDREGQPLGNQRGESLTLCSLEEFKKLQGICRCRRCSQLLGLEPHWREDLYTLSEKQKALLSKISKRTNKRKQWCAVAGLCDNKTSSGWTSLHRSIRRLEARGLVEKKINKRNRALVRLTNKGAIFYRQKAGLIV